MASENYIGSKTAPNRPETFFKYVTAKVAKIILVNHKIRWSSPILFNDPFDVQRDFDLGFNIEELKEPLVNEVMSLILTEKIPDLSGKPFFEWLVKCLRREDRANERNIIIKELPQLIDEGIQNAKRNSLEIIKKQWSEFIHEFRILCLSELHDNLLMWSHYCDSHKGVVLELQCVNDLDSPWLIAQPVVYQNSPPILATKQEWIKSITGQKPLNVNEWRFYEPFTITKTKEWEYEKEWRVVSFCRKGETGLFSDYEFNLRELRSVYLGCDMSDEDIADIILLLKYDLAHVKVFHGKKSGREKRLSFERMKP